MAVVPSKFNPLQKPPIKNTSAYLVPPKFSQNIFTRFPYTPCRVTGTNVGQCAQGEVIFELAAKLTYEGLPH
jgi:hypothetical protein